MKYLYMPLIPLAFFLIVTTGNASYTSSASFPNKQIESPAPQPKKGFFAKWREKRSLAKQQKQQERTPAQSQTFQPPMAPMTSQRQPQQTPESMISMMCNSLCVAPKACQLSNKEVQYCNEKCNGQIDVSKCLSGPSWEIAKQQLTNVLDDVYSMDLPDENAEDLNFDENGNPMRPPRKDLGEMDWRSPTSSQQRPRSNAFSGRDYQSHY